MTRESILFSAIECARCQRDCHGWPTHLAL